ncbi:MAG: hypothetical protein ACREJO_04190 [Phycisphaerales bacterium]
MLLALCLAAGSTGTVASGIGAPRQPPDSAGAPSASPAQAVLDRREQLTELIRHWLDTGDRVSRDRLLGGLRRLRDTSLKPLFARLAVSNDPGLRRHGILGSAELSRAGELDLLAIAKMSDPRERALTIQEAMAEELVTVDQLQDVLRWEALDDRICAQIACRLAAAGKPAPRDLVDRLLKTAAPAVRLRVALSAMQWQETEELTALIRSATDDLLAIPAKPGESSGREQAISVMSDVRRDALWKGGAEFARRVLSAAAADLVLRYEAIATLLACNPSDEQATRECLKSLGNKNDLGGRLMTGLAVLEAGLAREQAPSEVVDGLLADGDPLIKQMGDSMRAVLAGCGSAPTPLGALAGSGHGPSAAWALRAARKRAWQDAQEIRLGVIASVTAKASRELIECGAQAAGELCDDDPASLRAPLEAALKAGETRRVQVILLGAAASRSPRACEALPESEPVWPDDVSSAVAAVLRARCSEPNDPQAKARFEALATVAAGRGNLSPVLRFQAAWQALRAVGDDRATLARVLSGD